VHYEVYRHPDRKPAFSAKLSGNERTRYLQLPDDVTERIRELAKTWTAGKKTEFAKAKIIEKRLRTEFEYDLSSPSGSADKPLDHFLFESKAGHCEYYSTAMAVMLRSVDIPSRNVTGFIGGTYNKFGKFYAVRQGDAHSWVEAYIKGRGWLTFDPTPPGQALPHSDIDGLLASVRDFFEAVSQRWNQHVLNYDLRQQVSLFESLSKRDSGARDLFRRPRGRTLLFLLGVLIALASFWWWMRRRRRANKADKDAEAHARSREEALATNLYQNLDRVMSSVGVGRSTATPPLRHARLLLRADHPLGDEIMALTRRYLDARYGETPLTVDERRDFEVRVKKLKEAPRIPLQATNDGAAKDQPPAHPRSAAHQAAPAPHEGDVEITTAPPPPDSDDGEIGGRPDSVPPSEP
jgi:hypothetical protein